MENLLVCVRKKITMEKFSSGVKIVSNVPISKVLNVSARVGVSSAECINENVSFAGKVFVDVVFLSDTGSVEHAEGSCEFIEKQKIQVALADVFVKDFVSVENYEFSGVEMICNISHLAEVFGVYNHDVKVVSENEKDFVLNTKTVAFDKFILASNDDFVIADEIEVEMDNANILQNTVDVFMEGVYCNLDKVLIEGKVQFEVIVYTDEKIQTIKRYVEFKQEISAVGALPNMKANAVLCLKNSTITPEIKGEKTTLVCAFDLKGEVYVFEENLNEIVTDVFSLTNEVCTVQEYIEANQYRNFKVLSDEVTVQTNIADIEDFDDIVGVYGAKVQNLRVCEKDNSSFIEGNFFAWALYKSTGNYGVIPVESKVNFELSIEEFVVGCVDAVVQISSFKVKAGKEIEVSAMIDYAVTMEEQIAEKYLKSVEIGEEKVSNINGVKVYVSKGNQTVFDVAKVLNVRPEVIEKENEVEDFFEKGQKIYVYSQVNLF